MSIQSLNHLLSILNTTFIKLPYSSCQSFLHLSCLLLRPSLLSSGGHLWDRRDCTSTLPFKVSLPRMLQLCHLHGRVWTSHWRTRVWLWIIHLGDTERKKKSVFFCLYVCLFLLSWICQAPLNHVAMLWPLVQWCLKYSMCLSTHWQEMMGTYLEWLQTGLVSVLLTFFCFLGFSVVFSVTICSPTGL